MGIETRSERLKMDTTRKVFRVWAVIICFFFIFSSTPLRSQFLQAFVPGSEAKWNTNEFSFGAAINQQYSLVFLGLILFVIHANNRAVRAMGIWSVVQSVGRIYYDMKYQTFENGFPFGPLPTCVISGGFTLAMIYGLYVDYFKNVSFADFISHNFPEDEDEDNEKPHFVLSLGVTALMIPSILLTYSISYNAKGAFTKFFSAAAAEASSQPHMFGWLQSVMHGAFVINVGILFVYFHCHRSGATAVASVALFHILGKCFTYPTIFGLVGAAYPSLFNPLSVSCLGLVVYGLCLNVGGSNFSKERVTLSLAFGWNTIVWFVWRTQNPGSFLDVWISEDSVEFFSGSVGSFITFQSTFAIFMANIVLLAVIVYNSDDLNEKGVLILFWTGILQTVATGFYESRMHFFKQSIWGQLAVGVNILLPGYCLFSSGALSTLFKNTKALFKWSFTYQHMGVYLNIAVEMVLHLRNVFSWTGVVSQFVTESEEKRAIWLTEQATNYRAIGSWTVIICFFFMYLLARNADDAVLRAINYLFFGAFCLAFIVFPVSFTLNSTAWGVPSVPLFFELILPLGRIGLLVVSIIMHARQRRKQKQE